MYRSGNDIQKTSVCAGFSGVYRVQAGLGTVEERGGRGKVWMAAGLFEGEGFLGIFSFFFCWYGGTVSKKYNLPPAKSCFA
mgnify:CR=1 FL=1